MADESEKDMPNWLKVALESKAIKPGSISQVIVKHDDWCELLKGTGECNCNPDIRIISDTP